jgi:hypothetical protein
VKSKKKKHTIEKRDTIQKGCKKKKRENGYKVQGEKKKGFLGE